MSCVVRKCGLFECVLFVLFACVFSYFFVTVGLDFLLLFGWNLTKKHLVYHMEKNIIHLGDPELQVERDHGGKLFLRYQGEDVELQSGSDVIIWKSDGPPTDDELMNMTWRRHEKPITWSDRHSYNVTWTELSHDEKINVTNVICKRTLANLIHVTSQSVLNDVKIRGCEKTVKKIWKRNHFRLGMYRITTKLQIILLKASDFEIYTWSDAELLQELREHVINSLCVLLEKNRCHQLKHKNLT